MSISVELCYRVTFGKGDGSDVFDYDFTLTGEEEEAYTEAMRLHVPFDNYLILEEALKRAYLEIEADEISNFLDMDDELTRECTGRYEVDADDINDLVANRDPYTLDYFGLADMSDEELDGWDAYGLDELPLVCDFDEDFEEKSPFDCGWDLFVHFSEVPEDYIEDEEIE